MQNVRPIIMSAPMVRALLDGRKTQTRRVLKPQPPKDELGYEVIGTVRGPEWYHPAVVGKDGELEPGKQVWGVYDDWGEWGARVPYMPGDLLWVREPWQTETVEHDKIAPAKLSGHEKIIYEADADWSLNKSVGRLRPGMYMPRWASRLTLEVTNVRVQRLQEITDEDALAEGVTKIRDHCYVIRGIDYDEIGLCHSGPIAPFAKLWDSLYAKRGYGWDQNPWVIALTFVVHQMNIDEFLAQREAA